MAIRVPWAGVVVCGDYLSPVEIPWLSETGSRDAYLATLERLRPWVEEADVGRARPRRAARRRSARWRSCARTSPTSRRCPTRPRRCRWRAGPRRSARSTRRTSHRVEPHEPPAHLARDPRGRRRGRAALLGAARVRPRRDAVRPAAAARRGSRATARTSTSFTPTSRRSCRAGTSRSSPTTTTRRSRRLRDAGFGVRAATSSSGARRAASCARPAGTASRSWPARPRHNPRTMAGGAHRRHGIDRRARRAGARRLADHGIAQRLLVRDEARAPRLEHADVAAFGGYDDAEGMRRALDGHRDAVLRLRRRGPGPRAPAPLGGRRRGRGRRAADRLHVVRRRRARLDVHVRPRPLPHRGAHQAAGARTRSCATASTWTSSRCCARPRASSAARPDEGRVAAVARDDIADVAARRPDRRGPRGEAYDLTGIEAFTLGEAAAELSRAPAGASPSRRRRSRRRSPRASRAARPTT